MNEKFYSLPEEKRQKIINAGFAVFSRNSYRKSPVKEIADCAGISKSLLFHYFTNKKELYLFLWDEACRITMKYLAEYGCYEPDDLFEMMERGMKAKIHLMKKYPDITAFVIKAFYEKEPGICGKISESYQHYFGIKAQSALSGLASDDFVPGLNLEMMYREMYLASEGYLWEIYRGGGEMDVAKLEKDFNDMMLFWRSIYLKRNN